MIQFLAPIAGMLGGAGAAGGAAAGAAGGGLMSGLGGAAGAGGLMGSGMTTADAIANAPWNQPGGTDYTAPEPGLMEKLGAGGMGGGGGGGGGFAMQGQTSGLGADNPMAGMQSMMGMLNSNQPQQQAPTGMPYQNPYIQSLMGY